jgi:pilus assembly protein CpaC
VTHRRINPAQIRINYQLSPNHLYICGIFIANQFNMKIVFLLIILLYSLTSIATDFNIAIGETFSLKTKPLQNLRIQNKGIVSISDRGNSIVFTGKKLGQTQIQLGDNHYKANVLKKDHCETFNQLSEWLKYKRGPTLNINDGNIQLLGRLLRLSDFINLQEFTNSQSIFANHLELNDDLKKDIKSYVTLKLQKHNLPMGELIFEPQLQLQLSEDLKTQKTDYQKVLRPYGVDILFDENNVTQQPVIKIQVYIAHVKKSFMRQWGVSWPSEVSTNLIQGEALKIESFNVSLNALESAGQGQLLATPTLITESNKFAEFHSGGEFPITTTNQFNNSVQWKQYGLFLKAKPITNAQKHLQILIELELSTLDQSLNTNGVPALVRSQVKTQVNMKEPTPILLSGFLRQDQGDSRSGLPWLQQIPIFKPLFSTGAIYNNELELVFILVPSFYGI